MKRGYVAQSKDEVYTNNSLRLFMTSLVRDLTKNHRMSFGSLQIYCSEVVKKRNIDSMILWKGFYRPLK